MTFRVLFSQQVFIPERWAAGTKDEHNFLKQDSYEFKDHNLVITLTDEGGTESGSQISYYFPTHMWNEVKGEGHPPGRRPSGGAA